MRARSGGAGYSASKFGQSALGICLGREEGARGIRSSVIYPGEVEHADPRRTPRPRRVKSGVRSSSSRRTSRRPSGSWSSCHPRAHVPELVIKPTVDDCCCMQRGNPITWLLRSASAWFNLAGLDFAGRELVELGIDQVAVQLALALEL